MLWDTKVGKGSMTLLFVSQFIIIKSGGETITDQLELCFGIIPREFVKKVLWDLEEKKYAGRNPRPRKKVL